MTVQLRHPRAERLQEPPRSLVDTDTPKSDDKSTGHTMAEIDARLQEVMDRKPMVSRCGVDGCGWRVEGAAGWCRDEARAHREAAHPEIASKRLTAAQRKDRDIAESRARRAERDAETRANGNARLEAQQAPTIPASDALANRKETTMSATATEAVCKVDGCGKPSAADRGRFAKLCLEHRQEAATASGNGGGNTVRRTEPTDGLVAHARALIPAAKRLERARARLAQTASPEQARTEFREAMRRADATPTLDSLARLEKATKALRNGAPKRERAQREHDEALHDFNVSLAAIAAKVRRSD